MDDLKKFCYDNKAGMDVDLPGTDVWFNIEQKLAAQSKGRLVSRSFIYRVAAASVIIVAGYTYYYLQHYQYQTPVDTAFMQAGPVKTLPGENVATNHFQAPADIVVKEHRQSQLPDGVVSSPIKYIAASAKIKTAASEVQLNDEQKIFKDLQESYGQMVSYQLEKLNSTPIYAENAEYFNLFKTQFNDLDKDEKQLRTEIKRIGINDDHLMQMINIYQEKILLLKELQSEIIKMNNRYKSTMQDTLRLSPSFINFK